MFSISISLDFDSQARTVCPEHVLENHDDEIGVYSRLHSDGWTIMGRIKEECVKFYWVNDFEASHPVFGRVWGNFEKTVYADFKLGYEVFCASYPYKEWDYHEF